MTTINVKQVLAKAVTRALTIENANEWERTDEKWTLAVDLFEDAILASLPICGSKADEIARQLADDKLYVLESAFEDLLAGQDRDLILADLGYND